MVLYHQEIMQYMCQVFPQLFQYYSQLVSVLSSCKWILHFLCELHCGRIVTINSTLKSRALWYAYEPFCSVLTFVTFPQ